MPFGDFIIKSKSDLIDAINEFGFLPFFENSIEGFSIEEHIAPECWWNSSNGAWSAWEWKGPVIKETGCAYGKFFEKKACYISPEWFPDFQITAVTVTTLTRVMTTAWRRIRTSCFTI